MRITVFNDTEGDWLLHSGSVIGVNGELRIRAHEFVEFEGPDNSGLFIKVWDAIEKHGRPAIVMVRFTDSESSLSQDEARKIAEHVPGPRKGPFARAKSALFEARWRRKD